MMPDRDDGSCYCAGPISGRRCGVRSSPTTQSSSMTTWVLLDAFAPAELVRPIAIEEADVPAVPALWYTE